MTKRQIDTEIKEERMIREIRISDLRKYYIYPLIALLFLICGQVIAGIFLKHPYHLIAYGCAVVPEYYLLKNHAIGCVLMYKAFAPMETRERCRFEPTCSTYMIIAIKKYGLFIGVIKGLRRIFRCKPPNGGIDYP